MIRGPLQTLPQATAASATALVASNAQHVELADQITEYGRAVAGHFSSSVARSSVAAGKWFLQRLDGEKPDVFCHATQLMHGADSLPVGQRVRFDLASNVRRAARLTPLNVTGCTSPRGVFSQGANPIISNATVSNILPVVRHS
jgi:cold shock CspA family protein